jgi:SAM-dependent methyltransferase
MDYVPELAPEGFYRCNPIPSSDELQKYYQEEFYQAEKPGFINDSSKDVRDTDSEFYNIQYSIYCNLLSLGDSKFHSDLGCGYGHFLQYIANCFPNIKLRGCEVYPEAADFVECINNTSFESIDLNNFSNLKECVAQASTVSLVNTLEHLRDPVLFLHEVKNSLAPKTKLLLQVPNDFNPIQAAAVSQLSLDQWWFCPPRHVSYFTPKSLRSCVESVGFEVVDLITTFPIDMFLISGMNYRIEPALGRSAHQMRTEFEANFVKANGLGSLIHLYRSFATGGIGREIVAVVQLP